MPEPAPRKQARNRPFGWLIVLAVIIAAVAPFAPQILASAGRARLHAPDWALWSAQSPVLKVHVLAALAAFLIGLIIFLRRKGTRWHKAFGWGFVLAMGVTAFTSLFITGLNGDFYSLIHILSGWTLVMLPFAIFMIRRRNVEAHRRAMTGLFVGGLLVAGALTFLPGRFMFQFLLG